MLGDKPGGCWPIPAQALVSNFASQWLHSGNLRNVQPHADDFPDFDDNLREAFRRETELLFEASCATTAAWSICCEPTTFVNERLARHYGIPNVYGSQFRRVSARRGTLDYLDTAAS